MGLTRQHILDWMKRIAAAVEARRIELTDLDAAIGDGDHGINLHRGFSKVVDLLPEMSDKDIGSILKGVGGALIGSVGGASGPLYGTLFMRAGAAVGAKEVLELSDVAAMLRAGVDGVRTRGRAEKGDKTMLDTLDAAVSALESGGELDDCVHAARDGMESTRPLVARKGRASYLGERSAGHLDPGAVSSHLILQALRDAACSA